MSYDRDETLLTTAEKIAQMEGQFFCEVDQIELGGPWNQQIDCDSPDVLDEMPVIPAHQIDPADLARPRTVSNAAEHSNAWALVAMIMNVGGWTEGDYNSHVDQEQIFDDGTKASLITHSVYLGLPAADISLLANLPVDVLFPALTDQMNNYLRTHSLDVERQNYTQEQMNLVINGDYAFLDQMVVTDVESQNMYQYNDTYAYSCDSTPDPQYDDTYIRAMANLLQIQQTEKSRLLHAEVLGTKGDIDWIPGGVTDRARRELGVSDAIWDEIIEQYQKHGPPELDQMADIAFYASENRIVDEEQIVYHHRHLEMNKQSFGMS